MTVMCVPFVRNASAISAHSSGTPMVKSFISIVDLANILYRGVLNEKEYSYI